MAPRTGNGSQAEAVGDKSLPLPPRDRRLPLSYVEFKNPVSIDGHPFPVRCLKPGELLSKEHEARCPKVFIDPELQAIVVGTRHFPMVDVRFYERAKAA